MTPRTTTTTQRKGGEPGEFAGLRFAIYSRKSNEDARHEDHRSTARQVAQATAYVEARGGEVLPDHSYQDDAVSGAEFKNRAGLLRLLDALKNGTPFNAVVMSEESRLGREQIETSYILKTITDSATRVFYYMPDQEAKLDNAMAKIMSSLSMFGAEVEREKARQRSRDASERKARQGHVTGGQPFAYRNVRMKGDRQAAPGEKHDFVRREIREEEAEVVRCVFRMYAAGYGQVAVAKTMNNHPHYTDQLREYFGGRAPASPKHGSRSWAPAGVREMLYRRSYHGEIVWGKTTKTDRGGRAGISLKREEREWLVVPDPSLKIVPDDLWDAVQSRLKAVNATYLRDGRGKLAGKPDLGREGRYLLSGLAMCGICQWNLAVLGGVRRVYGCTHHHRRGVCSNGLAQPVALVDGSFLAELERTIMTPANFTYAVEAALDHVRERLAREPDVPSQLHRERMGLRQTIDKWEAAPLRDPEDEALLLPKIKAAKARITEIDADLARLTVAPKTLDPKQLKGLEREIEGELARFADLITGNTLRARQALKKLLVDRVVFAPVTAGDGKETYGFTGELSYGAVVRGSIYPGKSPLGPPIKSPCCQVHPPSCPAFGVQIVTTP